MRKYAKAIAAFIVAGVGLASTAITQGLVQGTAAKWAAIACSAIVLVASTAGVFQIANVIPPSTPPIPKAAEPSVPTTTPPKPL